MQYVSHENTELIVGEVIKQTSAEALKPSVVNITGPLIRILGDRFSFNVKVAVLETLGLLLGKVLYLAISQLPLMIISTVCNYSKKFCISGCNERAPRTLSQVPTKVYVNITGIFYLCVSVWYNVKTILTSAANNLCEGIK